MRRASALILLAVIALLAHDAAAIDNPLPPVPLEQYTLDNGLTVFLVEDHSVPIAVVNVNYMVGSKNEKVGRTGFAHLFEHMMYQGSKNWNADYFKPLQEVGGRVNGGTNTDRTRYWEQVPSAYLERALWLEADRMGFLLDAMTQERLDNQISVVQNERRQRYENSPYGLVRETLAAAMYPPNHPYSWTTIGSIADLQAATLDDVKEFFNTYYAPNNASICVAGDFDSTQVKAWIEKYFAAIPPGPPVTRLARWIPRLDGEVIINMQDRVELPRTYLAWHTVPWFAEDDAELDVFGRILGGGRTSRLYKELVYERQIAQDASANNDGSELAGQFRVTLTPRPGHTLEELEQAALEVLEHALADGITSDELARAQTMITADYVRSRQKVGGFSGISDTLNEYFHYLGQADMYRWDLQRYLDLTPEAVTRAARRHLGGDRVKLRVEPMPKLAPSASEQATGFDRSAMPGRGNENAFRLPERQRFTLDNGLDVILVEQHELPLVGIALMVRGGALLDPADRTGLSSLTAALLTEGAGGRSALEIAAAAEAMGAELDTGAYSEASFVSLSVLKERLDEGLDLFSDVVIRPDFPEAEVKRQQQRRLVRLQQLQDSAGYVAGVAMDRVIFGDHPYARPPLGDRDGVAAVNRDDVVDLWKRSFNPHNATLLVAGDIDRAELTAALADNLAVWRAPGERVATPPVPKPTATERTIYLIDKPGAAQSQITMGHLGAARSSDDFAALEVMNMILGGQFMSRLNLNLREDKGYTYGCRSSFDFRKVPGSFSASTSVETGVTAPAITEMVAELDGIIGGKPVSAEELSFAQGSLTDGYAQRFETPDQIVRELLDEVLYDLPQDTLETFPRAVREVSGDQVLAAARAAVHPDRLAIVVMGDAAKIRSDLEALELGPVVELGRDGLPLAD